MRLDMADLATRSGFRLRRVLGAQADRAVAQVEDEAGRRFALKADARADALAGDVAAIDVLRAAGLPVPAVVAHRAGPPSVLVLTWVEGEPISSGAPIAAQREAGRLLRMVHALPGGPPFSGQPSVSRWIAAWTEELAHWWPSAGGTAAQVGHFTSWLSDIEPVLGPRAGTLTLFDGRADHLLVRDGRVAGLIDLHDLGPGDPAMDLAVLTLTDDAMLPGVLDGYAADDEEQHALTTLIPFYLLLRRLSGAEWAQRMGDPATGQHLLRLAADGLRARSPLGMTR